MNGLNVLKWPFVPLVFLLFYGFYSFLKIVFAQRLSLIPTDKQKIWTRNQSERYRSEKTKRKTKNQTADLNTFTDTQVKKKKPTLR